MNISWISMVIVTYTRILKKGEFDVKIIKVPSYSLENLLVPSFLDKKDLISKSKFFFININGKIIHITTKKIIPSETFFIIPPQLTTKK